MADESSAVVDAPRNLREAIARRSAVRAPTPELDIDPPLAEVLELPPVPSTDPEVRALDLARVQCTPAEVAAVIAHECGWTLDEAEAFVADRAEALLAATLRGRAQLRAYLWNLAQANDPKLGKYATNTTLTAAMLLGKQHLGYTPEGVDGKVRRKMEKLERQRAHEASRNRGRARPEGDGG